MTDLSKHSFLITGGAGFIGSNLAEYLLSHKAGKVRIIDNFLTGYEHNIVEFSKYPSFEFMQADISDPESAIKATKDIEFVFHQAALGSVPRSILKPLDTNKHNVSAFLNVLFAAKENSVKRVVYASSSSVYGDSTILPKKEEQIGNPLSPYAVSKRTDELYADVFCRTYNMEIIGLRYFNVFGPRQNPKGPYAAVIPLFMESLTDNTSPSIFGDGEQLRDFTYIENVIQANLKAMFCNNPEANNQVFNIAYGSCITVNKLFEIIKCLASATVNPIYKPERKGDIRQSFADISKAKKLLDYSPEIDINKGLELTYKWFVENKHLI